MFGYFGRVAVAVLVACLCLSSPGLAAGDDKGKNGQNNQKDDGQQNQKDDGNGPVAPPGGVRKDAELRVERRAGPGGAALAAVVGGGAWATPPAKGVGREGVLRAVPVKGSNGGDGQNNQNDDGQRNQKDDGQQNQNGKNQQQKGG